MSRLQESSTAAVKFSLAAAVCAGSLWLATNRPATTKNEKPPPAATVAKVVKDEDFDIVTLKEAAAEKFGVKNVFVSSQNPAVELAPDAEKRIGLKIGAVEKKAARRVRVYGGEVVVPAGRTILVAAPLGGVVQPSSQFATAAAAVASWAPVTTLLARTPAAAMPKAGGGLSAGRPVLDLLPLLTPDGRATLSASLADADGQVNNARTQTELTNIALERARRVLKEGAGSQRQVDEAQAAYDLAAKTLEAITARRAILARVVGDAEAGTAAPIPIDAPVGGVLRVVSALPGQTVPGGAALFEVVDLSTVWVRVALPVGDLDGIDRTEAAQVGRLSAPAGTRLTTARPVAAPPSANPLSATVDLFYELANADSLLAPGQRLGVSIPLADAQESLTVPWSAVVFDVNGGTWVYEQTSPRSYVRRRVVVRYTSGTDAVLASGPAAGTKVVELGVQELFGAETGFIK